MLTSNNTGKTNDIESFTELCLKLKEIYLKETEIGTKLLK
jgi:hypothetical protein